MRPPPPWTPAFAGVTLHFIRPFLICITRLGGVAELVEGQGWVPVRITPPRRGSLAIQRLQALGEFRQVGGTDDDTVFDDLLAVEPERLL